MSMNQQSYSITVKGAGSGVLHQVSGQAGRDVFREPVVTVCGRTVRVGNVFAGLDDYRASFNPRGTACQRCEGN